MKDTTFTDPRQPDSPDPSFTIEGTREVLAATMAAGPIGETEMQAFGGDTAWNQNVRPGRYEARSKFLKMFLRASEIALGKRPQLEVRHIVGAIRGHALNPADLLICPRTGKWLSTPKAVRHRGLELAGSIAELGMILYQVEQEAFMNREDAP